VHSSGGGGIVRTGGVVVAGDIDGLKDITTSSLFGSETSIDIISKKPWSSSKSALL
jgi:hypothetical protein